MNERHTRVIGCGSYLPDRVLSNTELAKQIETTDDWIVTRTGIHQRHLAADDEVTSDLGAEAARRALAVAGLDSDAVDLIVVATTTPDDTFPATASQVQVKLGVERGAAFDVQAVCAGFVFALAVADNSLRLGQAKTALVIGAETYSRILDWTDRTTCVLFGDGAGALVLQAQDGPMNHGDSGILSTHLHTDGRHRDILFVDGGPSRTQTVGRLRMSGKDVFKHAVTNLSTAALEALQANGLDVTDVTWLVPHQANLRILDGVAKKLGLSSDRVIVTVDRHANTSAASIPLALDEACRDGRIKSGNLVLMEAIGGGLSWGSALVRW